MSASRYSLVAKTPHSPYKIRPILGEAGALERSQRPEYFDPRELLTLRGYPRHRGIPCKQSKGDHYTHPASKANSGARRVFCSAAHGALATTEGGILGLQRADHFWRQPRHVPDRPEALDGSQRCLPPAAASLSKHRILHTKSGHFWGRRVH